MLFWGCLNQPRHSSCFHAICYAHILWPNVVLPFVCANHAGHNAARMHTDSHVNIQIVALRPNLTDIAYHSQSQIDAILGMMLLIVWISNLRNTSDTVIAIAQKFYPQHIELFRRLIEFHEQIVQHFNQCLHRQLCCDLCIIDDICVQNTDTGMTFNVQFAEIKLHLIDEFWMRWRWLRLRYIYLIAWPRNRRFGIGSVRLYCKCTWLIFLHKN